MEFNEKTNKYVCPHCGKEYSKYGIKTHIWRNHTEKGKKFDPNKGYCDRTRVAWNKGLTKETDERVRKYAEIYKNRVKSGEIIPSQTGRPLSEEHKKKISEKQKINYKGKSIWKTQIDKRKSFAEKYFDDIFNNLEHNYFVYRYFLDIANCDNKKYIEIDGEQHYLDKKVIEHDNERTLKLKELGWTLVERVRWSHFKKLNEIEKENYIKELKEKIYQ